MAEESHDDRQWDALLVRVHGFGLLQQVAVDVLRDRGTLLRHRHPVHRSVIGQPGVMTHNSKRGIWTDMDPDSK